MECKEHVLNRYAPFLIAGWIDAVSLEWVSNSTASISYRHHEWRSMFYSATCMCLMWITCEKSIHIKFHGNSLHI